MSRKEEYKEKNLLYLDEIASEEGIRTLPCGILYKVIFITYKRVQAKSLLIGKASFPYIIKER